MDRSLPAAPTVAERPLRMSYEEWRTWGDDETRSEWVDGEVIVFGSTSVRHADLVGFLYTLLSSFVRFRDLGRVFMDAVEMRLPLSARVPDLIFVARDRLAALEATRLVGPADLVIEVVSPDSIGRDRVDKLADYAAAGIPEYWLVDQARERLATRFYHRVAGEYQEVAPDADGRYRSAAVPGFWFRPDWLEQDPLPDALDCLLEIRDGPRESPGRQGQSRRRGKSRWHNRRLRHPSPLSDGCE